MLVTTSSRELCSQALDLGPQRHDLLLELLATHAFLGSVVHGPRLRLELRRADRGGIC